VHVNKSLNIFCKIQAPLNLHTVTEYSVAYNVNSSQLRVTNFLMVYFQPSSHFEQLVHLNVNSRHTEQTKMILRSNLKWNRAVFRLFCFRNLQQQQQPVPSNDMNVTGKINSFTRLWLVPLQWSTCTLMKSLYAKWHVWATKIARLWKTLCYLWLSLK